MSNKEIGGHPLVSVAANLYFLHNPKMNQSFGIGVDHVWGEDPDFDFVKQEFVRFTVRPALNREGLELNG